MHIDLNSAFATAEQQAHPTLRGKAVGVTNRKPNNYSCVIACSYEAKDKGIKVGMRMDEAKAICPEFIMLETDPPKYHFIYQRLCAIMKSYSPDVEMKSIDEGIINFKGTRETVNTRTLTEIGMEIKERVRKDIGNWMRVNIGIGPNRFLAKQAAGWHKPDGLDVIDHHNLVAYYKERKLTDLTGIAEHFEARLNACGINTPMEFLKADPFILHRAVFKSVIGNDWHQRLRGYEVDDSPTNLGHVGRQYVLDKRTADESVILPRFHFLCETTAKKLRFNGVDARGMLVWAHFVSGDNWYQRKMFGSPFYTDKDIYAHALYLFNQRPKHMMIASMGVTCYGLSPSARNQLGIFEQIQREEWLTQAVDELNERYGNFIVHSADSLAGKNVIKQKIPFGGTKYFELLLKRA